MSTSTPSKRGRKPRGRGGSALSSPRISTLEPQNTSPQVPHVRWSLPPVESKPASPAQDSPRINSPMPYAITPSFSGPSFAGLTLPYAASSPIDAATLLRMPYATSSMPPTTTATTTKAPDEDADGDDELLPAMADDDYSAQLSYNSQSKDNLKVLMDNFTPEQYERFEAYRRHALPKQAVRKVIQQVVGQQVSQPVAQIVAGFGKVFVGEIVEKARAVQARRGETGPLSPDHLREAYRMYQEESGRVGAARPLRSKRLFVR